MKYAFMSTKQPHETFRLFQGLLPLSGEQVVPDILAGSHAGGISTA